MIDEIGGAGAGLGGALISGLLVWAGFKRRLDRVEETAITQTKCETCHGATLLQLEHVRQDVRKIDDKTDRLLEQTGQIVGMLGTRRHNDAP